MLSTNSAYSHVCAQGVILLPYCTSTILTYDLCEVYSYDMALHLFPVLSLLNQPVKWDCFSYAAALPTFDLYQRGSLPWRIKLNAAFLAITHKMITLVIHQETSSPFY